MPEGHKTSTASDEQIITATLRPSLKMRRPFIFIDWMYYGVKRFN